MAEQERGFTFFRYRTNYPPYRLSPEGEYHQFWPDRNGGWTRCNQNEDGLTKIPFSRLPSDAKGRAFEPAVRESRDD